MDVRFFGLLLISGSATALEYVLSCEFSDQFKKNTLSTLFTVEMSDGNRLYYKTCFALFTVVMRDMRDGEGVAYASLVLHLGYICTSHNYHVNFNTFHTLYS